MVVTALGVKREEKALGYAVQKVSGDELGTVKTTFVGTALTGKVAGLQVRNSTEFRIGSDAAYPRRIAAVGGRRRPLRVCSPFGTGGR